MLEYKNCTLGDLLYVVIDRSVSKIYEKYIELNVRYTSCYKGYDQKILFYMHDRPKCIVDEMIEKLAKLKPSRHVSDEGKNMSGWASENKTYRVDFGSNGKFCSCAFVFAKNGFFATISFL